MIRGNRIFDLVVVDPDSITLDVCLQIARLLRMRLVIGGSRLRLNFFLQSRPEDVAVIVVDWDNSTPDAFAQIRQSFPDAWLLLASERTSETDQHVAAYLGATQLLKKPLKPSELSDAVRFVIRSRGAKEDDRATAQTALPRPVLCWHCQTRFFSPEIPGTLDEIEKKIIFAALEFTKGDIAKTANVLGIGKKALYYRLARSKKTAEREDTGKDPAARHKPPTLPKSNRRTA
jgi:DNA-binding NtrC family response regulator